MVIGLQYGRAIAAILVVVFHANSFLLPARLLEGEHAGRIFNFGYAGVEFFFILSGYIMMLVHRADFGKPQRASNFALKRVLRIIPLYWVILTLLLGLYFAFPGRGPAHALELPSIIFSYLLVPVQVPLVVEVAWTLQHEFVFYAIFLLILLNRSAGLIVFVVWQIACLVNGLLLSDQTGSGIFLNPYNLLFGFGMIAALLHGKVKQEIALGFLSLGVILFCGVGVMDAVVQFQFPYPSRILLFGLGAALAIIGLGNARLPNMPWLSFLGDASYAIYLAHGVALSVLGIVIRRAGVHEVLPPLALLVLVCTGAVLVGALCHMLLERPLQKGVYALLTRWRARKTARPLPGAETH